MNLLFSLSLNKFGRKYNDSKDYKYILKILGHIVDNDSPYGAYTNMFRICCLLKTNSGRWKSDYRELVSMDAFRSLGEADKNYLTLYIFVISEGKIKNIFNITELDYTEVSNRTKRYFPLPIESVKTALKKYPDPSRGIAEISFLNPQN